MVGWLWMRKRKVRERRERERCIRRKQIKWLANKPNLCGKNHGNGFCKLTRLLSLKRKLRKWFGVKDTLMDKKTIGKSVGRER